MLITISNMGCQIYQMVKEALLQERERLYNLVKELPFLNPYPSYSNFILCEVTSGMDAKKLKVFFHLFLHIALCHHLSKFEVLYPIYCIRAMHIIRVSVVE